MDVRIVDFIQGAQQAQGIAIVIDVFRAFSLAPYAFANGVSRIIPVADIDDAFKLKREIPDAVLLGERHGRPLPGMDGGNSPARLLEMNLKGRTLIHTTHAGTQGLVNALQAREVITGALVNAAAIVGYVIHKQPDIVSIVRMGHEARERSAEDDACAALLAARLQGHEPDTSGVRERLRAAPAAARFFDPACDWAPEDDFTLCTEFDIFDFVLQLDRTRQPAQLRCIPVAPSLAQGSTTL